MVGNRLPPAFKYRFVMKINLYKTLTSVRNARAQKERMGVEGGRLSRS